MPKTATPLTARSVKLLRDIAGAASLRAGVIVPVKAEAPGMVCVATASGTPMWLSLANDCQFDTSPTTKEDPVPTASEINGKKPTVKPEQAARWAQAQKKPPAAASPSKDVASQNSSMPGAVVQIPLEKLHRHPKNRRVDVPQCADLAERMKQGQLTPCIVRPAESVQDEFTDIPVGHYQLLAGERRMTAAMINGWETLACIVREVGDVEALRILNEENAQREDLTDIEKAEAIETLCLPVHEGGAGYTREQAGKIYNLSAGGASNLVRLLELPAVWRQRVAKGELPQTFARELLHYASNERLVKAIDAAIAEDVKEDGRVTMGREDFLNNAEWQIERISRSLDNGHYNGPQFKIDDATRAKLEPFKMPDGEERTLNVKLWEKLQSAARNRKADPHDQHAHCGPKGKGKAKATEKPKPPTAAELAQKAKEAAERTKKAIAAWRLNFLREILAQTLDYSRMAPVAHLLDIWLFARPYAPSGHHTQEFLGEAIKAAGGKSVPAYSDAVKYMAAAAAIVPTDRWKVQLELGRRVLRADDVELPATLIEPLALECEIDLEKYWRDFQSSVLPRESQLVERFFQLHTTDQLVALAGELGAGVMPGAKKSGLVQTLKTYHRGGRTLALPKSIAPLKEPRKSPKKGGAKK